jgi:hypothetical protein
MDDTRRARDLPVGVSAVQRGFQYSLVPVRVVVPSRKADNFEGFV